MIHRLTTVALLLALTIATSGCKSRDLASTAGYLQFYGDTDGARFTLRTGSDGTPFMRVQTRHRYRISPGNYTLTVVRRGRTIVDHPIEVVTGEPVEVELP